MSTKSYSLRCAKEESFSDAIDRLLCKKPSLLFFAGVFRKDDEELKLIDEEVRKKATI
jgi:predicted CopG family antitoxin